MAVSMIMAAVSTASAVVSAGGIAAFKFLGMVGFRAVAASFLVSTALGAVLNALTPKPSFGQARGFTLQGESGAALDHQIIYGEARVGGARIYDASTGTNNEYLHRILTFAGHEIASYQQIWINDAYVSNLENTGTDGNGYVIYNVKQVTDPDGTTSNRYDGLIQIKQYLGTTNQPADANLITDTASLTNGEWTSDHKLSGVAYLYVRFKYNTDAYPNGVPAVSAIIRGKKVYDPRISLSVWSDNPALCIRDYLTSDYGLNVPSSRIDDTLVTTAANICEESVESEERYTCNGAFVTSLTPGQILTDLLTSMGGLLWYAQGEWRMKAAAYTSPVLALDEDDLRSQISVSTRHSRRDGFNKVKGIFRGPDTDWQQTDYPAVESIVNAGSFVVGQPYTITSVGNTNFTLIGASSNTVGVTFTATGAGTGTGKADYFLGLDNGLVNVLDYNLPFTSSPKTAQRIARIALNRNREQLTVSASFGMRAFAAQVGDIVTLTSARFGWTNKEFEILSWTFGLTEGLDIQVQMTLRETSSGVFTNVNGESFSLNNTTLPKPFDFPAPTGLTVTDAGFISGDGTFVNSLIVSWTPPANAFVSYYELEWKVTSASVYNSVDVSGAQYQISPVQNAVNYTVRVRAVSAVGVRSLYATTTYTAGGDVTAPGLPTSISATGDFKYITISWTNPADLDLSHVEVYENTTNNSGSASLVGISSGNQFIRSNLGLSVTRFYFLKAVDFSGNKSAFTTGVSATTTYLDDPDFEGGIKKVFEDAGLSAPEIVSSLPTTGNFQGRLVFLTTDNKLYRWTGTAWTAAVPTVDLTGTISEAQIAANAVTVTKIANAAVEEAKLATGAATEAKIATNAITETKISSNAVTAAKINAGAVTAGKIAAGAVQAGNIAAGAIVAADIAAGTITGNKIATNTLTATNIAAGTITATQIATGTITANNIAGNTITGDKIVANTITGGLLATSGIITQIAQIGDGLITNAKIENAAITTAKIGDAQVNTLKIAGESATIARFAGPVTGSFANPYGAVVSLTWTPAYSGDILILAGGAAYQSGADPGFVAQLRRSTTVLDDMFAPANGSASPEKRFMLGYKESTTAGSSITIDVRITNGSYSAATISYEDVWLAVLERFR